MSLPGFVLVGGLSQRFGQDKALFPLDGEPMALRVARAMGEAGLTVRLVAPHARHAALGLPLVIEPPEGPGHPLRGVVAALRVAEGEGATDALFAPCDLPWLPPEAFRRLLGAPGLRVAVSEQRVHPLLCQIPVGELDFVASILRDEGPARALAARATLVELDPAWTRNLNRPPDLG